LKYSEKRTGRNACATRERFQNFSGDDFLARES